MAKGGLYLSLGALTVQSVFGGPGGEETTTTGAIEQIARQPFGQVLLVALTIGLASLTLWNVLLAATGDPVEGSERKDRVKFAAKAAIYAGVTLSSARVLGDNRGRSGGGGGGSPGEQQAAARLLDLPAGTFLTGLAGLAVAGFGLYVIYHHGLQKHFMKRLAHRDMSHEVERAVGLAGRAGYTAKGLVFTTVGALLVVAALQHDANQAGGLSAALHTLAGVAWGRVLLWIIAFGLVLYGVFSLAEARYRRTA
ncbi:MAG: hypothetical protein AVDCRST_MAG50-2545 [uncultured Acidimicrobiales bacterium]|uniref:DUF1206 domain-containing protein n=1 Tax=uncultured Acidimicrobiales bacterium TaxID=310071 RepID=A0A6J4IF09_9ACTN|nr:MAG: hypothetical protein AVDCRST_MAG50-2545 [uncultured Acidimicrobiales bacterium]